MRTRSLLPVGCLFLSMWPAAAEDWPQYEGPRRDDLSAETGLLRELPPGGPPLLWICRDVGVGLSGPAIVGDRLYTLGGRGETEFLICLDLGDVRDGTVQEAWSTPVGSLFDFPGNNWSTGPSATPTVEDGRVYALGGAGHLLCADAGDGRVLWKVDLPEQLRAEVDPIGGGPRKLGWGFTWSPLVDGEKLICLPGGPDGTLAALDKRSGKLLWRSTELTDQAAYTSPVAAEFDGVRQYVVLTNQGVFGVDAEDGRLLWSHRRSQRYTTEVVNTPIVHADLVYVTVGGRHGCDLIRIRRDGAAFQAEPVYSNANMANHHGNVILVDGHVYGFSQGFGWICQALLSGEVVWAERRRFRAGAMIAAENRFYCFGEDNGEVVMIDVSPGGWMERGRFTIPEESTRRKPRGKLWTPPVISGGRLFLRDQDLLFCYDVRAND